MGDPIPAQLDDGDVGSIWPQAKLLSDLPTFNQLPEVIGLGGLVNERFATEMLGNAGINPPEEMAGKKRPLGTTGDHWGPLGTAGDPGDRWGPPATANRTQTHTKICTESCEAVEATDPTQQAISI